MIGSEIIPYIFTKDQNLIKFAPNAIFLDLFGNSNNSFSFDSLHLFIKQLETNSCITITLVKQGLFLIPLVLILPYFLGINGIWYSFPISDVLSAGICFFFLNRSAKKLVT